MANCSSSSSNSSMKRCLTSSLEMKLRSTSSFGSNPLIWATTLSISSSTSSRAWASSSCVGVGVGVGVLVGLGVIVGVGVSTGVGVGSGGAVGDGGGEGVDVGTGVGVSTGVVVGVCVGVAGVGVSTGAGVGVWVRTEVCPSSSQEAETKNSRLSMENATVSIRMTVFFPSAQGPDLNWHYVHPIGAGCQPTGPC